MSLCFSVFMLLFYINNHTWSVFGVIIKEMWRVTQLDLSSTTPVKHETSQIIKIILFLHTTIPVVSLFLFVIPAEVSVASSSGVQMAHRGSFTPWCLWGVSEEAAREGGLSISLIYERPYWACYARAKTGRDLLSTKSHLRVDCVKEKKKRGRPITNSNSIKSHAGRH